MSNRDSARFDRACAKWILLGLLVACFSANAATLDVSIANPTHNTDNSNIPSSGPGALESVRIEYGDCIGDKFGQVIEAKVILAPGTKAVFSNVPLKLLCVRALWRNNISGVSEYSPVSFAGPAPKAGSTILITVSP